VSKLTDFVHVNVVSGEMGCRDDRSSIASKAGEGLAIELREVLHSHEPKDCELIPQRIDALVDSLIPALRIGLTHDMPWVNLCEPLPV
jgi:hypothetical protein